MSVLTTGFYAGGIRRALNARRSDSLVAARQHETKQVLDELVEGYRDMFSDAAYESVRASLVMPEDYDAAMEEKFLTWTLDDIRTKPSTQRMVLSSIARRAGLMWALGTYMLPVEVTPITVMLTSLDGYRVTAVRAFMPGEDVAHDYAAAAKSDAHAVMVTVASVPTATIFDPETRAVRAGGRDAMEGALMGNGYYCSMLWSRAAVTIRPAATR